MQKKIFFVSIAAVVLTMAFGLFTSCKDYDDEISSLYQFIMTKNSALQEGLQIQIDALNKQLSDLKKEQASCKENCQVAHAQLQAEILVLQSEIDELKELQAKSDEEQDSLASEISNLEEKVAAHASEIAKIKEAYSDLQDQYNSLSITISSVENELSKINAHLSQVDGVLQQHGESIEQLTQTTVVLQQAITDANNALAALVAQVESQGGSIKENAGKISNLESLMIGMTEDIKNVTNDAAAAMLAATSAYELAKQDSTDIANLKKTVDENSKAVGKNAEAIVLIYGDIEELKSAIKDLTSAIDTNKKAAEKAISDLEATLSSKLSTLQDKLDETSDLAQEAKDIANAANANAAKALANSAANLAAIEGLTTDVDALKTKLEAIASWQTEVNGKISDIYDKLSKAVIPSNFYTKEEMDSKLATLKKALEDAVKEIKDNYATKTEVEGYLKGLHTTIDAEISALRTELMGKISDVESMFADYYTKTQIDTKFQGYYTQAEVNELFNTKLSAYYTKTEISGLISNINDRIDGVDAKFSGYYTKSEIDLTVSSLEDAYKQADAELSGKISNLNDRINSVVTDINTLKASFSNYINNVKKQITGIIIQGTYNPVIGTFNLPTNLSSNILSAFYGKSTKNAPNWPVCSDGLTSAEATLVGLSEIFPIYSGDLLLSDDEKAYAGKVYLTVNPSSVDFSNTTFSLVNSRDEESALKLGELTPSDKEITFGWTRSASNGFYEADAYIDMDDIENVKASNYIDIASLKPVVKEAINKIKDPDNKTFDVQNAFKVIESALSTSLPALGVKSCWQWTDESNTVQSSSVYSQYAIAGAAVQPLSYEFLKDWDAPQIKTLAHQEFEFAFNLDMPTFDPITEPDIKVTVYQVKATITAGGKQTSIVIGVCATNDATPYGATGVKNAWDASHPDPSEQAVIFEQTFTAEGLSDFIDQINTNIIYKANTSFEKMKDDINKQIKDQIDKVTNKINTQVIDRINSAISKVNNVIKNANHYLQPTILYYNGTTSKWAIVSNSMIVPTAVSLNSDASKNYVVIEPTTFTAELLSPAYRKYVAVTNVIKNDFSVNAKDGDGTCKNILAEANRKGVGLNEIFGGHIDKGVYLPKAGYIYEITYVALDYSGNSVKTTYYFKAI